MNKLEVVRILSSVLASVPARPVQYLDPGSGSYLLQLLIAGILGALFALRLYWKRVRGFFLKLMRRGLDEEER